MTTPLEQVAQEALREAGALRSLNQRSLDIFRRIVESYLVTGEPVGSRNLSRLLPTPLSPASIRNVMQALEESGLIFAPHTSAGRLPTEIGLRFFVDALLEIGDIDEDERRRIEAQLGYGGVDRSFETILTEATTMLSGMTRGAGVVVTSKDNARLKHIEFIRLEPERALAVLVGEDGGVENRVLPIAADLPPSALVEAGNYLNARIRGRTLGEVRLDVETSRKAAERELSELTERLVDAGLASWAEGAGREAQLIVRGQANLLTDLEGRRRPRAHPPAVRRSGDQEGRDRHPRARRGRGGRANLHRLGEQAVLPVGLLDDRGAVPRRATAHRRRARRDRPDAPELRADRPDGRLYVEATGPAGLAHLTCAEPASPALHSAIGRKFESFRSFGGNRAVSACLARYKANHKRARSRQ